MTSSRIYTVESHEEVLELWRARDTRAARVVHLDFHCDMRGLLIDRRASRAYQIWDRHPQLDEGNFLTYAVLEGLVTRIRWVHDEPGGRRHDLQTVKYESDFTAVPHWAVLAATGADGVPVEYDVVTRSAWAGDVDGWILDIDWDFFAALEYDRNSIETRVDDFLARHLASPPQDCFVCYSAEYCHPTRALFRDFVATLCERWGWEVVQVVRPPPVRSESTAYRLLGPFHGPMRSAYRTLNLALRSRGIF